MTATILDFAAHKAKRQKKPLALRVVSADKLHSLFRGFPLAPPRGDGEGGPQPAAA